MEFDIYLKTHLRSLIFAYTESVKQFVKRIICLNIGTLFFVKNLFGLSITFLNGPQRH